MANEFISAMCSLLRHLATETCKTLKKTVNNSKI